MQVNNLAQNVHKLGQLSDADLRLLRVFKAVVDCGGMAAAELEVDLRMDDLCDDWWQASSMQAAKHRTSHHVTSHGEDDISGRCYGRVPTTPAAHADLLPGGKASAADDASGPPGFEYEKYRATGDTPLMCALRSVR